MTVLCALSISDAVLRTYNPQNSCVIYPQNSLLEQVQEENNLDNYR